MLFAAVLCIVMLAAGILCLIQPPSQAPTAIRLTSAAGMLPASDLVSAPRSSPTATADMGAVPVPGRPSGEPVSLSGLANQAMAEVATTSTTAPATAVITARMTTTIARAEAPTTTTAPSPPSTATTVAPGTTVVRQAGSSAAVAGASHSDTGEASWFVARQAGTCAHRTLAKGTMVKVTRTSTGASTTCRIDDWGPTEGTGRIIDLSPDVFETLASKDAGVIQVRIEW